MPSGPNENQPMSPLSKYEGFLKGYSQFGTTTEEDIRTRLQSGESHVDRNALDQLSKLSKHAETNAPAKVLEAREILSDYFKTSLNGRVLLQYTIPILYGSLQYGDPRNFDADLTLIIRNHTIDPKSLKELKQLMYEFVWSLNLEWEKKGFGLNNSPHIDLAYVNADYWKNKVNNATKSPVKSAELFDAETQGLSSTISGITLLNSDFEAAKPLRDRALQIAESDPLIATLVNVDLNQCLNTRLRRQQGKV